MTIVRVGATEKYSTGWEKAFGKEGGAGRSQGQPRARRRGPKAVRRKKAAGKKKSKKKK